MTAIARALRLIAITGLFALPFVCLIVSTDLFFPFITGKNFAFRIIVEVMALSWFALALIEPQYRPRRSWVFATVAAFVALIAVSDAFGVNPFKSFWSNFERMDGWVTIAHFAVYTIVAASVAQTEKIWKRLFQVSLGVSVFLDLYGFSQIAGVLAIGQGGSDGWMTRIDATFGNPIYLAAYMLFHVFIAALLWVQMHASTRKGERMWPAIWYGTVIALDTIALLLTGTRGTTLGLIGGFVLAGILYVFSQRQERWLRPYVAGGIALLIIAAGALHTARDTSFVKSVGFLDRLASISLTDTTIAARFLNMHTAWQGVKERPILGWGQENYAIVFDRYYDPRMYADEPWFDRVHNIIFDWWIAGGTIGLLAYLSIFAAAIWAIWKGAAFSPAEKSILTGLLAGYFVHNLAVFDNVTSYILFGTVLAYIAWRHAHAANTPAIALPHVKGGGMAMAAASAAGVCAVGVIWFVNGPAYMQNHELIQALSGHDGGASINLDYFKHALARNALGEQEAREQLVQIATQVAGSNISADLKQQFGELAYTEMQKQAQQSPLDARFPMFIGALLESYGQRDAAMQAYQKALSLTPNKQPILYMLAASAQRGGDSAAALAYYKQAYDAAQANPQARIMYAAQAIIMKNDVLADGLLAPIIPTGQAASSYISAAYADRGAYQKIVTIWQAHIKAQPSDTQAYYTLAAAYYALHQSAAAIAVLETAVSIDPSAKTQADEMIAKIKAGK